MIQKVAEREYSQFDIDYDTWAGKHPFGFSGCVRVRNDEEFLYDAVASHLPYLDECTLLVQPSEDRTEEFADDLAHLFPSKIRVVRYPVVPVFITDPKWLNTSPESIYSFVYLSNYALSLCRYSWIVKFEADVIACPSGLERVLDQIHGHPDELRYYGRVVLNLAGLEMDQFSVTVPRNGGWDEGIFPNNPKWHFLYTSQYEVLDTFVGPRSCMGWSGLHMKRCKARNIGWGGEEYAPFDREHVRPALETFNARPGMTYPGPDDPLGDDCLYEVDL